jgi:hypothetical protein
MELSPRDVEPPLSPRGGGPLSPEADDDGYGGSPVLIAAALEALQGEGGGEEGGASDGGCELDASEAADGAELPVEECLDAEADGGFAAGDEGGVVVVLSLPSLIAPKMNCGEAGRGGAGRVSSGKGALGQSPLRRGWERFCGATREALAPKKGLRTPPACPKAHKMRFKKFFSAIGGPCFGAMED